MDENIISYTTTTENSNSQIKTIPGWNTIDPTKFIAELNFPHADITIRLNKKLNWFQRLCYNILGFKYKKL